jgi:hypothetical protein
MARSGQTNLSRNIAGRRKGGKSGGTTTLLVVLAIAAIGAVAGGFYWTTRTAEVMAVNPDTLCPTATGPVAETALLFDLTDPLTPAQSDQLLQQIESLVNSAPVGMQFTMGIVSPDVEAWGATAPLCKPRSERDVSTLTQNVALVQARYEDQFLTPLRDQINSMIGTTGADSSPIMESLQALLAATPGFMTAEKPRRLIIVSDLLQHSDVMSFYRGDDWGAFATSSAFARLNRSLQDADILIFRIPRTVDQIDDPGIIDHFWLRYFDLQGARVPQVITLGDL